MKHGKFLVTSAIGLLALGVISTSIALYVSNPGEKTISIGGSVSTNGTYTLTKVGEQDETVKLAPDAPFAVEFELGMNKNDTYTQNIVVGKIDVNINDASDIMKYINISASIVGYNSGTFYENTTIDIAQNIDNIQSWTGTKDVPFSIGGVYGTQKLRLEFEVAGDTLDDKNDTYIKYLLDKTLTYNVKLSSPEETESAYVVGNFDDCNWNPQEKYKMVPDITASIKQWRYDNLFLYNDQTLKALSGSTWSGGGDFKVWESDEDGSYYNITWNGNGGEHDGINVVLASK